MKLKAKDQCVLAINMMNIHYMIILAVLLFLYFLDDKCKVWALHKI